MQYVLRSFEEKALEVKSFFRFVALTLTADAQIYLPRKRARRFCEIDTDTQRVLKASALSILYNLVESTIRNAIAAIYEAIARDGLKYDELCNELKNVWIHFRTDSLTQGPAGADKIRKNTREVVDDIVAGVRVDVNRAFAKLSGNIDARRIRRLAREFGFSDRVSRASNGGQSLEVVKDKRNDLAHGIVSFTRCGGEFTVPQLEGIRKEIVIYLRNILRNIERYVTRREYAA